MEPEEEQELQEAVIREIKRRRKGPGDNDAPVSLQERRVSDKASITEALTQYKSLLTPWSKIMAKCLEGKEPKPFVCTIQCGEKTTWKALALAAAQRCEF